MWMNTCPHSCLQLLISHTCLKKTLQTRYQWGSKLTEVKLLVKKSNAYCGLQLTRSSFSFQHSKLYMQFTVEESVMLHGWTSHHFPKTILTFKSCIMPFKFETSFYSLSWIYILLSLLCQITTHIHTHNHLFIHSSFWNLTMCDHD